jgi:hypothetical protein
VTHKQLEAAFKSLAEELSRTSHAQPPAAEDENDQLHIENMDLAYLFRLIPNILSAPKRSPPDRMRCAGDSTKFLTTSLRDQRERNGMLQAFVCRVGWNATENR